MKELKAIINAYNLLNPEKTKAAIATVVRVEGSSYRRTGARMLVTDDGIWVGGISGGCLEGDALKRARLAMAKAQPSLVTYDTTEDDQHQIGVGLGCHGVIDVLLSPLEIGNPNNAVEILKSCRAERRQTHILLTIIGLEDEYNGLRAGNMLRYTGQESLNVFEDAELEAKIEKSIQNFTQKGRSRPATFELSDGRELEIFIEILPPEVHLVLMGHQYDVLPLTRLVKEIGWRATVVANPQKIMQKLSAVADEIVTPADFETILIDEHTAIILMSHDFKTDKYNLPKVLKTKAAYIGMLGPRVRSEKILDELSQEGIEISQTDLERIHAPVGLDIGAISPEEIALSIIAEIRAVFSDRNGAALRLRTTPIHERD
ncbi:XdhC family protein [Runella sp.]|uniref:XdhC family protein n=1 Tax=Runella sp. TaxID=1960881 RepID=UPI003D1324C9